jgi:hypothetical protein
MLQTRLADAGCEKKFSGAKSSGGGRFRVAGRRAAALSTIFKN